MKYCFEELTHIELIKKKKNTFYFGLLFAGSPLLLHIILFPANFLLEFTTLQRSFFDVVAELMWFCATVPIIVFTTNHLNFDIRGFYGMSTTSIFLAVILGISFSISVLCFVIYQNLENSASHSVLLLTFIPASFVVTWFGVLAQKQYINDEMDQFER